MSVEEYVAHRGLQVVHADTDLQDFQFELDSIEWQDGAPNDDQICEVTLLFVELGERYLLRTLVGRAA